ncbi:MAG: hypothetical protein Q7R64_04305 [bacterium]|nr:hypothetical protein [bacterium]
MAPFEQISQTEKGGRENEKFDEYLLKLWHRFNFKSTPPLKGSVAERRLHDACNRYTQYITNDDLKRLPQSDQNRRNLHNEIAIMLVGKQRSGMGFTDAEKIAEFACELSLGCTLQEAEHYSAKEERSW